MLLTCLEELVELLDGLGPINLGIPDLATNVIVLKLDSESHVLLVASFFSLWLVLVFLLVIVVRHTYLIWLKKSYQKARRRSV